MSQEADRVLAHLVRQRGDHIAQLPTVFPTWFTAHSLEPLRPWKAGATRRRLPVSSWIERDAFTTADAVIAVSHGMRRDILRSYPMIGEAKVSVVHNGIDLESLASVKKCG
jgi:starch synthase